MIDLDGLINKPVCLIDGKPGKKIMIDLTNDEIQIYEIEDCEFCGSEISHCDCTNPAKRPTK